MEVLEYTKAPSADGLESIFLRTRTRTRTRLGGLGLGQQDSTTALKEPPSFRKCFMNGNL